jgi:hypothetical protein
MSQFEVILKVAKILVVFEYLHLTVVDVTDLVVLEAKLRREPHVLRRLEA